MIIRKNGIEIEIDASEAPALLRAMGLIDEERREPGEGERAPSKQSPPAASSSGWTAAKVRKFYNSLAEPTQSFIRKLFEIGKPISTQDVAARLDIEDARGIGAFLASVNRRAAHADAPASPCVVERVGRGTKRHVMISLSREFATVGAGALAPELGG